MEPMGVTTPSSAFGCLTDAVKKQYEARKNTDGSIIYVFTGFPTHYACHNVEIFGRLYSIERAEVRCLSAQLMQPLDNNSSVGRPSGLGA